MGECLPARSAASVHPAPTLHHIRTRRIAAATQLHLLHVPVFCISNLYQPISFRRIGLLVEPESFADATNALMLAWFLSSFSVNCQIPSVGLLVCCQVQSLFFSFWAQSGTESWTMASAWLQLASESWNTFRDLNRCMFLRTGCQ